MNPDLRPLASQAAKPNAEARLVRDWTQGRQWGVDSERYGQAYVFTRFTPEAMWMIWAGPFVDETAAIAWVEELK